MVNGDIQVTANYDPSRFAFRTNCKPPTTLIVDNTAVLTFPGLNSPNDSMHLVIAAYNYIPNLSYILVDFPAGMDKKQATLSCSVLPNPSNGIFNLNIGSFRDDIVAIKLFNMLGNVIFEDNDLPVNDKLIHSINLTNQPEGIYFLTVKGKETTLTKKVLIQK